MAKSSQRADFLTRVEFLLVLGNHYGHSPDQRGFSQRPQRVRVGILHAVGRINKYHVGGHMLPFHAPESVRKFILQDLESLRNAQALKILADSFGRWSRALHEMHFLGPAAESFNAYRAGSSEQIEPHASFQSRWVSRRKDVEQRF